MIHNRLSFEGATGGGRRNDMICNHNIIRFKLQQEQRLGHPIDILLKNPTICLDLKTAPEGSQGVGSMSLYGAIQHIRLGGENCALSPFVTGTVGARGIVNCVGISSQRNVGPDGDAARTLNFQLPVCHVSLSKASGEYTHVLCEAGTPSDET